MLKLEGGKSPSSSHGYAYKKGLVEIILLVFLFVDDNVVVIWEKMRLLLEMLQCIVGDH